MESQRAPGWLVILGVGGFALGACAGEDFGGPVSSGGAAGQADGGGSGVAATGGNPDGGTTSDGGGGTAGAAMGGSGGGGGKSGGGGATSIGGASGDAGGSAKGGAGGNSSDHKLVFVTSVPLPGTFATGTDAHVAGNQICATEAAATEALNGKQWRAWLSTGITSAVQMLAATTGPWKRVDGALVFNSPAEIKNGIKPVNPIDRDATGALHAVEVWTGTNSNGSASSGLTCQSWTGAAAYGVYGLSTETSTWTNSNAGLCTETKHLYCFEI